MRICGFLFSALMLCLGAAAPAVAALHPVMPEDVAGLRHVTGLKISPDGKTVLFDVTTMEDDGSVDSAVWQTSAAGGAAGRVLLTGKGNFAGAAFTADGRHVAYLAAYAPGTAEEAKTPEKSFVQVWLADRDGQHARQITHAVENIISFDLSPDGRWLAYTVADPVSEKRKAEIAAKMDGAEYGVGGQRARLWIEDLKTGEAKVVTPADMQINHILWSPDSRHIAIGAAKTSEINDLFYHTSLRILDAKTGEIGPVINPQAAIEGMDWSPDGRRIAFTAMAKDYVSVTPMLYDTKTGKAREMLADYPGLIVGMQWMPDSKTVVAEFMSRTKMDFVHIDTHTDKVSKIGQGQAIMGAMSLSKDGKTLAYYGSSPTRSGNVWALTKSHNVQISEINPQVKNWDLGKVKQISWKSSIDGRKIYGVLVTPSGYKPGTPIKTVVQIHGGPEWWWWSGWLSSWHEWAQMLASHGFAVLLPNPRGSDGQGTAFTRMVRNDFGGADYQDVLDGLHMLEKQKIADPKRVGIGGWSYGGFMSAWAVGHGDTFKTAIVGAGVTDIHTMGLASDTPDFIYGNFDAFITDPKIADEHSPLNYVANVHVPVLILHGQNDTRVPISQGYAFFNALRWLGKPVKMYTFPREHHWIEEKGHKLQIMHLVLDWFTTHL